MTKIVIKEASASWRGTAIPAQTIDAEDIRAFHTINKSLTINLKNGTSIGQENSNPAVIFERAAKALGPEKAKEIKVSLTTDTAEKDLSAMGDIPISYRSKTKIVLNLAEYAL